MPLYVQLAQIIRQEIRTGQYSAGDILPGELALASRYGVSPDTVRRAVRVLREERAVVVQRGIGNVVQEVQPEQIVILDRGDNVTARLPTTAERERLGLAEGVPVLVVYRSYNGEEQLYDANRTRLIPPQG